MIARHRHLLSLLSLFLCLEAGLTGADRWIEVKTEHFTVVSNHGDRSTRRLVWRPLIVCERREAQKLLDSIAKNRSGDP